MELEDALNFLRENQPLPDDPDPQLLQRFGEVCLFFCENAHPECIPLLLNACNIFNEPSFYDSINAALSHFPKELVVPHLVAACKASYPSIRLISADVASHFPHALLVEPLEELMQEGVPIIRMTAAAALECIGGQDVIAIARQAQVTETDDDVLEILWDIIHSEDEHKDED